MATSDGSPAVAVTAAGAQKEKKKDYLQIKNVSKLFGDFTAVDDVSVNIHQGEIFALLGASGCGKSTLLRMLGGFDLPTKGEIWLDGENLGTLPPYSRPINMMFQSYALFPHMTVEKNIAFGLQQDNIPKSEIGDRVTEMLRLVQMERFAKRKPHQLSGGQQQRVALARSLVKSPKLLLLDEPLGALDKKLRTQVQLEIVDIIERLGVTCVMVTHDQEEAMTMASRIAVMNAGEIKQVGEPHLVYEQPNSRFSAEFIGSVNLFEGELNEDHPDWCSVSCDATGGDLYIGHGLTGSKGMECALAVRPEKIAVSATEPQQENNKFKGKVDDIAYLGSHSVYHVRLPSGFIVMANAMNADRHSDRFTWEDDVWLSWEDDAGVVLMS
ncbi:MAG: polyamine ABC transporter ATP-binding protein [Candidatus Pelagadaptatus aseana]|uniref:ABC transporter ATP-binding protein n=1 Tax=Candidatus Pelagadaptatus aseana TaxID=3120508 RepID=UPI0039B31430